jgi:hypothetical protein
MRRPKDLGKRQKMEPHDHRAPVGGKVGTMKSIRQDRNKSNGKEFKESEQQELPPDRLQRGHACCGVLFAEQATCSKYVDRASQKEQRRKSKRGTSKSVERPGLAQAPTEPTRSKHGHNQCPAARTDNSLSLRRQIDPRRLNRNAARHLAFAWIMLKSP